MLTYRYVARNAVTGQKVDAVVEADSEQAASKLIRGEGLTPIDIKLEGQGISGLGKRFGGRVKAKDKVLFSRQLSTLIDAGLPLVQALRSVNDQTTSKPLKVVLGQVISSVEGGSALSVALAKHPAVFNQVYISLVAAGETSGTLDKALERLAVQQEKDADLASKVRGAMTYPVIVIVVMIGVVGFMMVKVIPAVKNIYASLANGASLPLITRIIIDISDAIMHFWWIVLIVLILAIFFGSRWARTGPGKQVVDSMKMRAWPVGPLFMKIYMARFARTGSTLVASGVPLLQVLQITANAVNNVHVSDSILHAAEKVKSGKSLGDALSGDRNFLPLVPNMLKIGEQSGTIEQMMGKCADYYEKEVDNEIASVSSIIEPVMMVLLGIVAFIIVAAVLLPIYGLTGKINTG